MHAPRVKIFRFDRQTWPWRSRQVCPAAQHGTSLGLFEETVADSPVPRRALKTDATTARIGELRLDLQRQLARQPHGKDRSPGGLLYSDRSRDRRPNDFGPHQLSISPFWITLVASLGAGDAQEFAASVAIAVAGGSAWAADLPARRRRMPHRRLRPHPHGQGAISAAMLAVAGDERFFNPAGLGLTGGLPLFGVNSCY